jgi:heterotetrameric sarcosine oxidase delta subunit
VTRLECPYCGPRELEEFAFRKTLAEPDASDYAAVYERANRIDESDEHWQHVGGCRAWLRVRRNPSTGEVCDVHLLGGGRS